MLYLVPKIPSSPQQDTPPQNEEQRFMSDFQEVSPKLFSFYAQNASHDLRCSLLLEIQDVFALEEEGYPQEDGLAPMLVGDFPAIDEQRLFDKVHGDEYLQGIFIIRFYLNILESLLLFCEEQDAIGLMLTVDENCLDAMEIYREFIATETQVFTDKGAQTQIMISTSAETYDALLDFIDRVDQDFCQTLWRNQRENPIIRRYLKFHAVSKG